MLLTVRVNWVAIFWLPMSNRPRRMRWRTAPRRYRSHFDSHQRGYLSSSWRSSVGCHACVVVPIHGSIKNYSFHLVLLTRQRIKCVISVLLYRISRHINMPKLYNDNRNYESLSQYHEYRKSWLLTRDQTSINGNKNPKTATVHITYKKKHLWKFGTAKYRCWLLHWHTITKQSNWEPVFR